MYFVPPASQDASSQNHVMWIWNNRLYFYSAAALVFGIWLSLKMALKEVSCHFRSGLRLLSPSLSGFPVSWKTLNILHSPESPPLLCLFVLQKSVSKVTTPPVRKAAKSSDSSDKDHQVHVSVVKIFYGSQTGTAKVQI